MSQTLGGRSYSGRVMMMEKGRGGGGAVANDAWCTTCRRFASWDDTRAEVAGVACPPKLEHILEAYHGAPGSRANWVVSRKAAGKTREDQDRLQGHILSPPLASPYGD